MIIALFDIRLQGIIADLEHRLEKQVADHARSTVARDLELEALRQQEEKMRMEIVQLKENTDRLEIVKGDLRGTTFSPATSLCHGYNTNRVMQINQPHSYKDVPPQWS